ncbi:hypothetical protein PVNG_06389 [Plasmodium vivax North Korean]|uniref:Uncharacterized protein n=1 Tax=Plasmodium vivax North Korean TaxID=1035514 RepID=A0A0J9TK31_PLAVI|nr:hypothetical protein PVNG_06389 [Plasmodium vivax North Korean]
MNVSNYTHVKGIGSNNFEAYMKDYKRRYRKKNGFFKLDCYCGNIVLDKIHNLHLFGQKMKNDKKCFKTYFLKKYGIGLILFSLIPTLGFIFPVLFGVENWGKGIFTACYKTGHENPSSRGGCSDLHPNINETTFNFIGHMHTVFSFTMIIIVIFFCYLHLYKINKI